MEPKRTKYDTNPLDDKVADRAEQSLSSPQTEGIKGGETQAIGPNTAEAARSEAPTRRIDEKGVTSYPSIFIPAPQQQPGVYLPPQIPLANIYQPPPYSPPNIYQPPPRPVSLPPRSHSVAGLGIPEKWANVLPYIPGHVGAVAAVIELLLVPRSESRTRFHAAQGLALQLAILVLTGLFSFISLITGNKAGSVLFGTASTILLIISIVRVLKGRSHHIAPLDEPARWLDDKVKPRK